MNPDRVSQTPQMVAPIQEPPPRKRGVFLLALLALLLIGGAVGGVLWWRGNNTPPTNTETEKPTPKKDFTQQSSCSDDADPKYYEPIEYGPPLEVAFDRTALDALADKPIPDVEVYPWLPENLVAIFGEHRMRGDLLAVSPDGKHLATGITQNGFIRIGEIDTLHEKYIVRCPTGARFLAWSPLGDTLAVNCNDGLIRLYNVENLERVPPPVSLEKTQNRIRSLSFSGDGKYLIGNDAATETGSAWVWDVSSRKIVKELKHDGPVQSVAFSPVAGDYRALTAGGPYDGFLHLWDALAGTQTQIDFKKDKFDKQTSVGFVSFAPDGKRALSCHPDGKIRVWDLDRFEKDKVLHTLAIPRVPSRGLFTPDGKSIVSVGQRRRSIELWNAETGKRIRQLATYASVRGMHFVLRDQSSLKDPTPGKDREVLLAFTGALKQDPNVHLLEMPTGKERMAPVGHLWSASAVNVSPSGKAVVSAGYDRTLRVWDLAKAAQRSHTNVGQISNIGFVADAKRAFVFGPSYTTLGLFDVTTGKSVTPSYNARHSGVVVSADVTGDGRYAVTGGQDGTVRMWRLADGFEMRKFDPVPSQGPAYVSLCPDMRRVIRIGRQNTFLLHLRCKETLHEWKAKRWAPFLPNSEVMFFAGKEVTTWKVLGWDKPEQTGNSAFTLPSATAKHITPDGKRIAVLSQGRVVVLDRDSQRELWSWLPPNHFGGVADVALSPDGGHLMTANGDGTIYVIQLP